MTGVIVNDIEYKGVGGVQDVGFVAALDCQQVNAVAVFIRKAFGVDAVEHRDGKTRVSVAEGVDGVESLRDPVVAAASNSQDEQQKRYVKDSLHLWSGFSG
ncbi:MAG: hypothetical protein K2M16_05710 [Muribaculaceae bacterium]|nr:hypothetical protein [Muribaculaceae bacterium]